MKIKNWEKFQHYKHRDPTWIKLHRSLLEDRQWHLLSGEAAKVLISLWLVASSSNDGELPELDDIAFKLRTDKSTLERLISELDHWLEHGASDLLASCEQAATSEKSREESRVEGRASKKDALLVALLTVLDEERAQAVIDHRRKLRKPLTERAAQLLAKKLAAFTDPAWAADEMITRGWQSIDPDWKGLNGHARTATRAPQSQMMLGRRIELVD